MLAPYPHSDTKKITRIVQDITRLNRNKGYKMNENKGESHDRR